MSNHIGENFIYCHIPKTGGESIIRCLHSEGKTIEHSAFDKFYKHKPYDGFYPHEHDEFYFSFVRNPFPRLVSAWLWSTKYVFMKNRCKVTYSPKVELDFEDWFQLKFYSDEFWSKNLDLKYSFGDNFAKIIPQKIIDNDPRNLIAKTLNWYKGFCKEPQVDFLKPNKDSKEIYPDFLGRQENMKSDWDYVKKHIGIKSDLPNYHKSKNVDYRKFYTPEMKQKMFSYYEEDFNKLNYDW